MSQRADFLTNATHPYMLCGWHTRSEMPFTGVPTSSLDAERIDVFIQVARGHSPISKTSKRLVLEHSAECSRIGIDAIADFEVRAGKLITVWPVAGAAQKDIEGFLFGPVWATLCHQRNVLPLHASAILSDGRIAAFAGRSGAGKSTTAALMHSLNYRLFADDIVPITLNDSFEPGAWPYLRRLKLQGDSILQLALTAGEPVSETLDKDKYKYFVHPKYAADDKWSRLERLYLLEIDADENSIEQIGGAEAVSALVEHTFHFDFVEVSRRFDEHLAFCTRIASKIAVYRLRRSSLLGDGRKLRSLIGAHLEKTI